MTYIFKRSFWWLCRESLSGTKIVAGSPIRNQLQSSLGGAVGLDKVKGTMIVHSCQIYLWALRVLNDGFNEVLRKGEIKDDSDIFALPLPMPLGIPIFPGLQRNRNSCRDGKGCLPSTSNEWRKSTVKWRHAEEFRGTKDKKIRISVKWLMTLNTAERTWETSTKNGHWIWPERR